MVTSCFVNGCTNRMNDGGEKISFYVVPNMVKHLGKQTEALSTRRRAAWIASINRQRLPTTHSAVCADHFLTGKPSSLYDSTHPDWVPTLLMKEPERQQTITMVNTPNIKRYERSKKRTETKVRHDVATALLDLSLIPQSPMEDNTVSETSSSQVSDASTETDEDDVVADTAAPDTAAPDTVAPDIDLNMEIQNLRMENLKLKQDLLNTSLTQESFEADEKKVQFLTGLPSYITLMAVFEYLSPSIPEHLNSRLSKFKKYILVLMKLRLGTQMQDLGYRFGVSKSTISRTFVSTIHVMYEKLKSIIYWPAREQLRQTMPLQFRENFDLKVAIVIDCFEIFIERPSNLSARADTWSQYKHHNTIKFLIGVTPQGTISFLSKSWGGRTSDKKLTNNSGFLDNLLPGDLVLADMGFDIRESVGLMCAEVNIPAFTKGKPQLPPLELESTRKIANVRIHVERVIGLARNKYTILKETIPIDYLITDLQNKPLVDKIVTVCCALTNFCPSVVIFD